MTLRSRFASVSLFVVCLCLAVSPTIVQADLVNGNPASDPSWMAGSNSLDSGSYIRGAGNFGYDTYSTSYLIPSGSPLVTSGWSVGDQVLGVGGSIATNDGFSAGWGAAFTGDAVNSNLTGSARIVAKFGASPTAWVPSTVRPDGGNGSGSFSSGHGGDGAILLGTGVGDIDDADAGLLLTFDTNQRFDSGTSSISSSVGRLVFNSSGDILESWSVYLNTSLLASLLPGGSEIPQAGDRINLTLQRSTNSTLFTDAMVSPVAIPEPSALLFGTLVCSLIGVSRRNRS